jgi:hypothetical protein
MRDNIFHCKRCNEFCHINEQTEYYLCINCTDELELEKQTVISRNSE